MNFGEFVWTGVSSDSADISQQSDWSSASHVTSTPVLVTAPSTSSKTSYPHDITALQTSTEWSLEGFMIMMISV